MYNAESEQPKGNILIVDDLLENLRLLSELLNKEGYKVRSATNGKMALKTVRAKPPDLILLDIKMPEMDGYEVCETLKKDNLTAEIPVIFLSASDELFDKVKAFKNGGIDYITKPFQIEEVIVRIENQLTIQRQKKLLQKEIYERKKMELALQAANQELERLVNVDGLTGIANRRRFNEYINQEWQSGLREKQPLSLIMCDVDYFKLYNDREGHLAGDQCLTKIAEAMNQAVKRPRDLLARYGGEEFGLILPNTPKKSALQVAKELQQAVKDIKIPHPASAVSPYVSLSLGVSSVIPNRHLKFEMLIAAADDGLYEAKKQGRDRFVFSNERLVSHSEKSDLTSH